MYSVCVCVCVCVCVLSHFSCVQLFVTLWTIAHQTPLAMGFSRQEYWNELPFPSLGDIPKPGIKPTSLMSPALAGKFFTKSATWEAHVPFSVSNFDKEASVQIIGQNLRLGSLKADIEMVFVMWTFFFFFLRIVFRQRKGTLLYWVKGEAWHALLVNEDSGKALDLEHHQMVFNQLQMAGTFYHLFDCSLDSCCPWKGMISGQVSSVPLGWLGQAPSCRHSTGPSWTPDPSLKAIWDHIILSTAFTPNSHIQSCIQ